MYRETEMLLGGPYLNTVRTPVMNEVSTRGVAEFEQIYRWGLDSLVHELKNSEIVEIDGNKMILIYDITSYSPVRRDIRFDNRTDVRWGKITDVWGRGLAFWGDHLLNVAVNPYTNLQNAWYPYQLERAGTPVLNIDHMVTGVGGTPVAARERYRTYLQEYSYSLFFLPF